MYNIIDDEAVSEINQLVLMFGMTHSFSNAEI